MLFIKILLSVVGGLGALVLLGRVLNSGARRRVMVALTFLAGLYYVLEFVLPAGWHLPFTHAPTDPTDNFLSPGVSTLGDVTMVIGSFAFGLGLINLAVIHGKAVARRSSGWINSFAFFVAMTLMALTGLAKGSAPWVDTLNRVLMEGLYLPLGASVFSILAFFITTAAYRAFRIRSGEATLMMIAAFIVMMAQVPMGMMLTDWLPHTGWASDFRIEVISNWLMTVLNMAALRAVGFGIGVGGLAMSLRIWLSLEKGSYFGKEM